MTDLLKIVAERASLYLERLDERSVAPSSESLSRLKELHVRFPDGPTDPADVIALLDDIGSPATVASAGSRYFFP